MKCPRCGKEMTLKNLSGESYLVCDDCRVKMKSEVRREDYYEELPPKKKKGKGKIVLICVIAFFAIGLIGAAIQQATTPKETKSAIKGENNGLENTAGNTESAEPEKELTVSVGQTIVTENMEITINKVELTYDVLPDDTSGFYTHYQAESGNVYLHVDCNVKNLQKQNLPCDEILKAVADYNNGFTYKGTAVVDDASLGFTYANITSIAPLETMGVHYLFTCPQEVEQTNNPLYVTITPAGTSDDYKLIVR